MPIAADRITYPGPTGEVSAYLARPAGDAPWPAIVVVHEFWGLTEHIEDVARRFAGEGYLALAPDLYCHDAVYPTLKYEDLEGLLRLMNVRDVDAVIADLPAERQEGVRRALAWRDTRDASTYLPDLLAAVDYLQARPDVRAEAIGAIGYCMGGGFAGRLAAAGADLAAAVIYYGGLPPVEQIPNVRCAVQAHYGTEDPFAKTVVPSLQAAMNEHGKNFTLFMYEGAPHAFFNDTGGSYRSEAAQLAWRRTLGFFEEHLKRAPVAAR
jgi:carboxymethylenebutenolidase